MFTQPLILSGNYETFVLVQPRVVECINRNVELGSAAQETGGILLGSYRGNDIEIHDFTVPFPTDIRTRYMFDRGPLGHQEAAMCVWRASKGTDTYVGEWHTHPEQFPTPSPVDLRTWHLLIARRSLPLVFAIGGERSTWWGLGSAHTIEKLRQAN